MTDELNRFTPASIPRLDELTGPPVFGRRYLVPHVRLRDEAIATAMRMNPHWVRPRSCWPVLGPVHEDAAIIGTPDLHYHLDPRFLCPVDEATWGPAGDVFRIVMGTRMVEAEALLPATCWSSTIEYPRHRMSWLPRLEEAYAEARVDCRTCPHRGVYLGSLQADEHGAVTCPGHGLSWNLKTGRLAVG